MKTIYRLIKARQAGYGIGTDSPTGYETLRESFGEYDLSIELGEAVEAVGELPDDASYQERWDTLAKLEGIPFTWAEQQAVRDEDARADELLDVEEWARQVVGLEAARRLVMESGRLNGEQVRRMSKVVCVEWLLENEPELLRSSYQIEKRALGR